MLSEDQLNKFKNEGYLVIENFINSDQCSKLYDEAGKIIENVIDKEDLENVPVFPFIAKEKPPSKSDFEYFMESGTGVKLFLNKQEFATESHTDTAARAKVIRRRANRIGHALHALNPVFKEVTFSGEVKDVVKSLDFEKPIVCQSMYLMMQSPVGPTSTGHQTSSFVIVEPCKLVNFWIAVTDCTPDNGCLELIPGSHKKGAIENKFIRNPNQQEYNEGKLFVYTAENPKYEDNEYKQVPLKPGSLLLMDGYLIHRATNCTVHDPRNVYAFHVYDSDKAKFSKKNWLKYSEDTFLPLF